jgi:class 3 adenylate cyclase
MTREPKWADQLDIAQHRDITVMFVDLAGSTELAHQLDLESYHLLVNRFLERCVLSIESAEGYVARFMGDGVLAYFGYPQALEESAARAITAAFEIRDGCERLGQELSVPLSARCGIASGGAIIGKAADRSATGQHFSIPGNTETNSITLRIYALAAP